MTNIDIPSSIESIGATAFGGTPWLTNFLSNQPNGVVYIGNVAHSFKGSMSNNTSITIKEGTLGIAGGAFQNRTQLVGISFPNSLTNIDSKAFKGCTGLTNISIPNTVTLVAESVFEGCTGMTGISIPNSVTKIYPNAFSGCTGLTNISIPNSVTFIGSYAFKNCTNLTSVSVEWDTPITIYSDVFSGSNYQNATLYVPQDYSAAYEAANVWKDFNEIKEVITQQSYTLSSVGMGTYCSEYDLDFTDVSGIKAYIACGFNPTTGIVFIMHVNEVPANTGIMIKGTPGTYSIPVKDCDMYYANMFKGTLTPITVPATEDGYKNYVLASDKLFHGSLGGSTLAANRAYLQIPLYAVGGSSNAPEFITLEEDNVTGIVGLENTKQVDEGETYNLNGQRVVSPKKGLYIRNGKKVIINK